MDIDTVKKTVLESLKKVQKVEQLNVSDTLLEKIAIQLTENLCEKIEELDTLEAEEYIEDYLEFFDPNKK